jgi:hypothetical protein
MTEQQPTTGDDVEGHAFTRAFAEGEQAGDDVEGHAFKRTFAESDEAGDDVEGHAYKRAFVDEVGDDDVSGHLSGALGTQKRDDGH